MSPWILAGAAGLFAGVVHVLSGPDHLAAVLPFAVMDRRRALGVGLTWGVGHGLGVLLLALAAWLVGSQVHLEAFSGLAEALVGVMLLLVGAWSLRSSRLLVIHAHAHDHPQGSGVERHAHLHVHLEGWRGPGRVARFLARLTGRGGTRGAGAGRLHNRLCVSAPPGSPVVRLGARPHLPSHARHRHSVLGFGLLHGLAGAGHLLGVLPSVALGRLAAASYLAMFLAGGLGAMALFAFLAGRVAVKPSWVPRMLFGAGVVSMAVGAIWLASLSGAALSG